MVTKVAHFLADKIPNVSFAFLGLGVVQAWISLMMGLTGSSTFLSYYDTLMLIDLGSLLVYMFFLAFAHKSVPLFGKRLLIFLSCIIMLAGSGLAAASAFIPALPESVFMVGLSIAGSGLALITLCWWEVYGVLSPVEVALYYSGCWILREVLILLISGYNPLYHLVAIFLLPIIAAAMLSYGRGVLGSRGLVPKIMRHSTSFPWKPLLLVALYGFAYGCGTWLVSYDDNISMHLGRLIPALLVCSSILFSYRSFNFTSIYRYILPVAIVGLLALLLIPSISESLGTLFMRASYTSIFIYASILICNLSKRYHISAVWIFSLVYIIQIVSVDLGSRIFSALPSMLIVGICIVCIVFMTVTIISEPTLDSDWSIVLAGQTKSLAEQMHREALINALAAQYGLSSREHEILSLLELGNLPRSISRELHIAPGTVKAHIQHIYKKMGIHSKEELAALLEN